MPLVIYVVLCCTTTKTKKGRKRTQLKCTIVVDVGLTVVVAKIIILLLKILFSITPLRCPYLKNVAIFTFDITVFF
jgi:hypothetical protein